MMTAGYLKKIMENVGDDVLILVSEEDTGREHSVTGAEVRGICGVSPQKLDPDETWLEIKVRPYP